MPQFKIFRSIHYWWHYAIWKMKLQLHVVDNSQIEKSDSLWSETQWNLRRTNKSSIFGRRLTDFLFLEYLLMTPLTLITPLILVTPLTLLFLMTPLILMILMTPLTLLILLKPNPTLKPYPTQSKMQFWILAGNFSENTKDKTNNKDKVQRKHTVHRHYTILKFFWYMNSQTQTKNTGPSVPSGVPIDLLARIVTH